MTKYRENLSPHSVSQAWLILTNFECYALRADGADEAD